MNKPVLPAVPSQADYAAALRQPEPWRPAIAEICRRHALTGAPWAKIPSGSNVVFAIGDRALIKLFAPPFRRDFFTERAVLERVHGRLGVATPDIITAGDLEGWPYLVVTHLSGTPLGEVWAQVPASDQRRIVSELGEILARLHAVPAGGLDPLVVDWNRFVGARTDHCVAHHEERGAPAHWLRQIPAYLAAADLHVPATFSPVLLNADVTDEHVLLAPRGNRWEITGLIDFGDAMIGCNEYEFVAPGLFIIRGRPELLRAFLLAYGYRAAALTPALRRRLMAYTLLHRFSNLTELLALIPETHPRTTLHQLAATCWPLQ